MAPPTPYTPPQKSLGREFVEAFFTLFVGVFLQVGRFVRLLVKKSQRAAARRAFRVKAVQMGQRMNQSGTGDQLILKRLQTIPESDTKARAPVLASLGELGLESGVPLLGLEEDYEAGHAAYRRARQAEYEHDEAAYLLVPHSALGWTALLGSYALTLAAIVLLAAYLNPSAFPPAIARWVGRESTVAVETPTVSFNGVRVEVVAARIARTDMKVGDGDTVVVVNEGLNLLITIRITNTGSQPLSYTSWRGRFATGSDVPAKTIDDRGITLARMVNRFDTPPEGGLRDATIEPGQSVDDVLIYGPPEPKFKRLDLFLPGDSVGVPGETKQLTIPAAFVEKPESYK